MNSNITITLLGTRGSVPVNDADHMTYGGATSCVSAACGSTLVYLDAGNGILLDSDELPHEVSILFSHLHLDHLIGLPYFGALFSPKNTVHIYGRGRSGRSLEESLKVLFSPPYWPVGISDFPATVHLHDIEKSFTVGDFTVTSFEGAHPGGSTIYRLANGDKSFVYATDFEHNEIVSNELIAFAKDADLMIYDAQYTEEEYPMFFGYGHSTPAEGIRIAKAAGVGQLIFTHHAPAHDDAMMAAWEAKIQKEHPFASFAKAGMKIEL